MIMCQQLAHQTCNVTFLPSTHQNSYLQSFESCTVQLDALCKANQSSIVRFERFDLLDLKPPVQLCVHQNSEVRLDLPDCASLKPLKLRLKRSDLPYTKTTTSDACCAGHLHKNNNALLHNANLQLSAGGFYKG